MKGSALFFLVLAATRASLAKSQDFSDILGIFGGDDDESTNSSGFGLGDILDGLGDLIDGTIDSLSNSSLPPELQELFQLPNFENFTFSFGGNCTICDGDTDMEGVLDGLICNDWEVVAYLGIQHGSDQCNFLRVAAVEYCGCPVPAENQGRTCPVCPEGQGPGPEQQALKDTVGITCADVAAAPAVDGDATCASVDKVTSECDCQPLEAGVSGNEASSQGGDESGAGGSSGGTTSSEEASASGGAGITSKVSLLCLAAGMVIGVSL